VSAADRPSKIDVGITIGKPGRFDDEDSGQWKEWLKAALPDELVDRGIEFLLHAGFEVLGRSRYTLSLRGPPELFESTFASKVGGARVCFRGCAFLALRLSRHGIWLCVKPTACCAFSEHLRPRRWSGIRIEIGCPIASSAV